MLKFLKKIGLGRIAPKWLGDRADLLAVGGTKSKGDADWRHTNKEIFEVEKRKIVAYLLEAAIHVVFSTHVYKFCGKSFLQRGGSNRIAQYCQFCSANHENLGHVLGFSSKTRKNRPTRFFSLRGRRMHFLRPLAEGWKWSTQNLRFEFSKKSD